MGISNIKMPKFRADAKAFFLTYPQCKLTKEYLRDFLLEGGAHYYAIGQEKHEDGEDHLHAYVEYLKRRNIINENAFDVGGYHPNIQVARNRKAVYQYVIKDGSFIKNCDYSTKRKYGELVSDSSSKESFLANVMDAYPRDMVMNLEKLQYFADWKWRKEEIGFVARFTDFKICNAMKDWVEQEMVKV